jgi:hypothetical protein
MEAREFYNKRIKEDSSIGSVQLMEEYAKHLIEINLYNGSSVYFKETSISELEIMFLSVNKLIDYCNS